MKKRVWGATAGLMVLLPAVFVGGHFFAGLVLLLSIIGLYELARMGNIPYVGLVGIIASSAIAFVTVPENYRLFTIPGMNSTYLFYICCMLLLVLTVYQQQTFNIENVALIIFGSLYIGYGFRYLIMLRDMGLDLIIFQFCIIWATDIGAYLVGRRFGKHRLAPSISPNKTIEGALGGVICAVIVSAIYNQVWDPHLSGVNHYVVLTVAISILGQLGDLVESAIKRHYQVKDSGTLIPGHGGVLDRFDSTIFTSFLLMTWFNLMK